jgi:hypothetical protein
VVAKRTIRASEAVKDIRKGMSNQDLMLKYRLTPEGLRSLLQKLAHARALSADELEMRSSTFEAPVLATQIRQTPRCYPPSMFPLHDMDDLTTELLMRDLSEHGVQVIGMQPQIGEHRTFLIQALAFQDIDPLIFEARCQWTRADVNNAGETTHVSGFQIVGIDETDLRELRKFIRAICGE